MSTERPDKLTRLQKSFIALAAASVLAGAAGVGYVKGRDDVHRDDVAALQARMSKLESAVESIAIVEGETADRVWHCEQQLKIRNRFH